MAKTITDIVKNGGVARYEEFTVRVAPLIDGSIALEIQPDETDLVAEVTCLRDQATKVIAVACHDFRQARSYKNLTAQKLGMAA
jgi:hypothetical protein